MATEPTSLPDLKRIHLGADGNTVAPQACLERTQNESYLGLATFASSVLIIHHAWLSYYFFYATAALHKSSSSLIEIDTEATEVVISPMHSSSSGTTRNKSGTKLQWTMRVLIAFLGSVDRSTSDRGPISSMMQMPMQWMNWN